MPSPSVLIFRKDMRELFASKAFWFLLLIMGPLVGHGFITAVDSYAEASGIGGGPAALAQGLSPLDGIFVPAFGAYDLAATLLFPFVAIYLISAERESGAWKLLLQSQTGVREMLTSKAATLLAAWLMVWAPGVVALVLWKSYGGAVYTPELLNLMLGYLLRGGISASIAVAAAACVPGAANAAIVTLGLTLGTWALEFVAEGRGGMLQLIASFTPTAALRSFEHGEMRFSVLAVTGLLIVAGFALAAVWMKWTLRTAQQWTATALIILLMGTLGLAASRVRAAKDLSEDRRNSFPAADEAALSTIRGPLHITVNLAAEDPRLMDLERNILSKLRRIVPEIDIEYTSQGRSGLFTAGDEHYGEIWYQFDGKRVMNRSTTEAIVLETIFALTAVAQPAAAEENGYAGHPLAARPAYAAAIFYLLWPLVVVLIWWSNRISNP